MKVFLLKQRKGREKGRVLLIECHQGKPMRLIDKEAGPVNI